MSASPFSNYPNGFGGGLTVRGVPILNSHSGKVFWVDSNATTAGRGTFDSPFTTIDRCFDSGIVRANKGDVVMVKAGHTEAITAAAGLVFDVAGVAVCFLGDGATRARITFGGAVGADMDIDAANVTLVNPLFVSALDALTGPIDVNAADFSIINGEYRDAAAMAATDVIVADAGADRMTIDGWRFVDSTTGTQKQSNIQIAAADDVILRNIDIVGDFGTGAIENGTAWVNALLDNVNINNTAAGPVVAVLLQATSTGTMRNSTLRVASGTTYLTANNDMQFFETFGTGTDATAGEKIGTLVAGDVETKVDTIVTRIGTEAATDPLSEVLSGTGGITTWKTAAAYATGVSISEVLAYVQDGTRRGSGTAMAANKSIADALGTDGTTVTDGAASVLGPIGANNANNAFSSATVVANHDGSALERLEAMAVGQMGGLTFNNPNYFVVTADMTSATFNTIASHEIATVTGMVQMVVIPQCTSTLTDAADGASIQLGIEGTTTALIASTGAAGAGANTIATNEFWLDATPADVIVTRTALDALTFVVGGGLDVGYEITGAALTGGTLLFHCWWSPLDATGAVAAGAGGTL